MKSLKDMGLEKRADHKPGELSGGEQQRLAIGRALVSDPEVLLADEPTGNLDSKTGEEIFNIILEEKKKRKMTLVMVTHNEDLAARAEVKVRLFDGAISYV
jgi:lipoprotein-releasing system ATP-binding protein